MQSEARSCERGRLSRRRGEKKEGEKKTKSFLLLGGIEEFVLRIFGEDLNEVRMEVVRLLRLFGVVRSNIPAIVTSS